MTYAQRLAALASVLLLSSCTTGTVGIGPTNFGEAASRNIAAQTVGQFLRPVPEWGVPPFAPATQSLEIYEQGTLILDIAAAGADRMIWRGSAQAELDRQTSDTSRDERIRSVVKDMLKRFPPKH